MGPTECAGAMVACTMPFLDNGLGANLAADYGCYGNEYWTSPYTAGGLSPMKQIEGEDDTDMSKINRFLIVIYTQFVS